jgi:hypothetical protein
VKPITVRNLPAHVARELRERAKREHSSLNGTVIRMLEERLGATSPSTRTTPRRDLSFLSGTWTKREAEAFDRTLARQRIIDKELWK